MVFILSYNGFAYGIYIKDKFMVFQWILNLKKRVFNGVSIENNNPRRPSPQGKLLYFKAFDRNHSWSVLQMVL